MLEAANLACIRGERLLFKELSFSIRPGELLVVGGANGSGKTSLLRMLCGLLLPAAGEIRWQGRSMGSMRDVYPAAMMYIGHPNGLKDELTGLENLRFATALSGAPASRERIRRALARMGLGERELLPTGWLSQGQKRRTALARLLLSDSSLWILDEPFTALDKAAVELVQSLLEEHLRDDGLVVLTTHQDLEVAAPRLQRLHLAQ